jgi:hypothetical protein
LAPPPTKPPVLGARWRMGEFFFITLIHGSQSTFRGLRAQQGYFGYDSEPALGEEQFSRCFASPADIQQSYPITNGPLRYEVSNLGDFDNDFAPLNYSKFEPTGCHQFQHESLPREHTNVNVSVDAGWADPGSQSLNLAHFGGGSTAPAIVFGVTDRDGDLTHVSYSDRNLSTQGNLFVSTGLYDDGNHVNQNFSYTGDVNGGITGMGLHPFQEGNINNPLMPSVYFDDGFTSFMNPTSTQLGENSWAAPTVPCFQPIPSMESIPTGYLQHQHSVAISSMQAPVNQASTAQGPRRAVGPSSCNRCNRTFTKPSDLERHIVSIHQAVQGRFLCPIGGCVKSQGVGHTRQDKVTEHLWKKHGNLGYAKRV